MDMNTIMVAVLAMIAVGGAFQVFVYPHLSGEARAEKRQAAIRPDLEKAKRVLDGARDIDKRRKQVTESLKELEQKGKSRKVSLEAKLRQAGLSWSRGRFFMFSAVLAVVFAVVAFVLSRNILYAAPGALVGGFGVSNWFLSFRRKSRIKKFVLEFPNAVDVIIRGVKAGLPLGDCIRVIASESSEPVKSEFRQIVESTTMGLTLGESVERLYERVPITEANFFSIVINIQQKSGGNLSEALGNLSRVLRDRKKMQLKIKAMSSEAKASAGIIGCLPFMVTGLLYISSPHYIELLWTTSTGVVVMVGAGFWMLIGVMSMKKMVTFDM